MRREQGILKESLFHKRKIKNMSALNYVLNRSARKVPEEKKEEGEKMQFFCQNQLEILLVFNECKRLSQTDFYS